MEDVRATAGAEEGRRSPGDPLVDEADDEADDEAEVDFDAVFARVHEAIGHCPADTIAKVDGWLEVVRSGEQIDRFEEADVAGEVQLSLESWTGGNGIGAATQTVYMRLTPARCEGAAAFVESLNDTPFVAWVRAESLAKGRPDERRVLKEVMGLEVFHFAPKRDPTHLFHTARGLPKRDLSKPKSRVGLGEEEIDEDPPKRRPEVGKFFVEKGSRTTRWVEGPMPNSIPSVIRIVGPGRGWLSYGTKTPLPTPHVAGDYDVVAIESSSRWGTATLLVRDRPGKRYRFVGVRTGLFGLPTWGRRHGQMLVGVLETRGHPRVPNQMPVALDLKRGKIYAVGTDQLEFFIDGAEVSMKCDPRPVSNAGQWIVQNEDDDLPCRHHVFGKTSITQVQCPSPQGDEAQVECVPTEIPLDPLFEWIRRH